MNSETGISVAMPLYNAERFVVDTIESVLCQSFDNFELIAVDDGSTDSSLDIVSDYARRDPRVVVLRQNHGGLARALNAGVQRARYNLIARIDSDDRMLPNRLERQLQFIEQHPGLVVACSNCYFIDAVGKRIGQSTCTVDVEKGTRERRPGLFLELAHPTVLMRKDVFLKMGGYCEDLLYAEDRHLWGRIATSGNSILCQNEFLTEFRLHGGSMTMSQAELQREVCGWIDLNIVRRLNGEPELSLEEFRLWNESKPFVRKVRERLDFTALHSFKKASRYYGEGHYLQCALSLAAAVSLNPGRMVSRVLSKIS